MLEVRQTKQFANWFKGLRDRRAKVRIQARIDLKRVKQLAQQLED